MKQQPHLKTQVAIVGAGLVGLAAAIAMQQCGFDVVLVDAKNPADALPIDAGGHAGNEWDQKVYAISPKNVQWLKALGVWQHVEASRIGCMQSMQIWEDASTAPLQLSADETSQDALAYVVENKVLLQALLKQLSSNGIQTLFDNPGQKLELTSDKANLHLTAQTLESELLLAADGAHSWIRSQANMQMAKKEYEQVAIVANFEVTTPHHSVAHQWFSHDEQGKNAILALLPLPGNRISIVWSVAKPYAQTLLALDMQTFTERVSIASGYALGALNMITPPASFPLVLQTVSSMTRDAAVLIGDAAHVIHPLAGQGMNLGFRDIIDLIGMLKEKNPYQSIHDAGLLKRYSRLRKSDVMEMQLLTDGLYQLFATQNGTMKKLRNWGMNLTATPAIKKLLVEKAIAL